MPYSPKVIENLIFDEWVDYVFNPSNYKKDNGYRRFNADWWIGEENDQETALNYLAQLFENSGDLLIEYSNQEIYQGLRYLSNNGFSGYMRMLLDDSIAWLVRKRTIESFYELQAQVFAPRCDKTIEPTEQPGTLRWLCYVWFNCTSPLYAHMLLGSDQDESFLRVNNALIDVMEQVLEVPSTECQMSALHGLGLWHRKFPRRVDSIITKFLNRKRSKWMKDVRQYAKKARRGEVHDWC